MSTMEKERPWWVALLFLLVVLGVALAALVLLFLAAAGAILPAAG